jgi:S-DNA-T family DNA segregation ATPase FtsK/SpoIIIE
MLQRQSDQLHRVMGDYGVEGEMGEVSPGPVVTMFEFEPAPGVKSSRVINLASDIARNMSAQSARIAVVPGRNALGVEMPNRKRETVWLRDMLESEEFQASEARLPLIMGEDIGGQPFVTDLASMPHMLVAGTTGSGKSVAVNAMILSLMSKLTPEECKFIMIDPKMLELSVYDGAPHLLAPVVTEPKKAVVALKWAVREMEDRYRKMSQVNVRGMEAFNKKVAESKASGETLSKTVQTGFDHETGEPVFETQEFEFEPMPYIVVIIDEMADLMMVAKKDIEGSIQRLAQMARAAGIHLIVATQRPSTDVITGTIKSNFPTKVCFRVGSKIDSRVILGEMGGEQLLGKGDMLFLSTSGPKRYHGPFVSDAEVERVANFVRAQGAPAYLEDITSEPDEDAPSDPTQAGGGSEGGSLFDQAVAIVANDRKASTSYIQRRLSIGYNRAADLIDRMEQEGMIGPAGSGGKREIFLPESEAF